MNIKEYDINSNFWEAYPELKRIEPFKSLRLNDKKANRAPSSRLMWAFAAFVDLSATNPLKNMPDEEKIEILEDDFINVKFDVKKYKSHIDMMTRILLSREHRSLSNLIQKLDERTKLIQDTKYTIENADKLDKLIKNTEDLLDAIKKMEASISAGTTEGLVKGGRMESASEKGLI